MVVVEVVVEEEENRGRRWIEDKEVEIEEGRKRELEGVGRMKETAVVGEASTEQRKGAWEQENWAVGAMIVSADIQFAEVRL